METPTLLFMAISVDGLFPRLCFEIQVSCLHSSLWCSFRHVQYYHFTLLRIALHVNYIGPINIVEFFLEQL